MTGILQAVCLSFLLFHVLQEESAIFALSPAELTTCHVKGVFHYEEGMRIHAKDNGFQALQGHVVGHCEQYFPVLPGIGTLSAQKCYAKGLACHDDLCHLLAAAGDDEHHLAVVEHAKHIIEQVGADEDHDDGSHHVIQIVAQHKAQGKDHAVEAEHELPYLYVPLVAQENGHDIECSA